MLPAQSRTARLRLAGEHAILVPVSADVVEDGFDVLRLGSLLCEVSAVQRIRADAPEEEVGRVVLVGRAGAPAAAQRRERPADVSGDELVDQREAVSLVLPERQQRRDL